MKKQTRFFAFLLTLLLTITSCSNFSIPSNINTAFENFTYCIFKEEVASNTLNLHYTLQSPENFGITNPPITLGSFEIDESAALASIENLESALHKFSYKHLSEKNKLTYDILSYHFSTSKNNILFHLYDEPLSPTTGIHAQLPVLLAEYHFYSTKDVDTYLALLKTIPDYFSSLIRFEKQKLNAGLFMSDALVDTVIEQCNGFLSMGDNNYLLSSFEERLNNIEHLTQTQKNSYISQNKSEVFSSVVPAYETLKNALNDMKGSVPLTQGLCSEENGKKYYAHLVSTATGSGKNINELKKMIQKQISSDLLSMNPNATTETISTSQPPMTILESLKTQISNTFPKSATVKTQIKYVPKPLEPHLSPAFYLIPAIDNFEDNTIYINQAYSLNQVDLFTTLAHEGYPGHLYQTTYFANTNPLPIRSLLNFPGYVEGWATYAEMCSYSLLPLNADYANLLQKNNSIILGLYATADIGIHYDGWSLNDTQNYFHRYGITDNSVIQEIYEYIVGDPANYLTYYIGYLEILELKRELIAKEKENFSQIEFHKKLLDIGPAPFEIIKKYLIET